MPERGPVIFCTDGSPAAQSAVEQACALLAPGPAEALCVWLPAPVIHHPHSYVTGLLETVLLEPAPEVDAANEQAAADAAEAAADAARAAGFACAAHALRSSEAAWRAILDRAEEIGAGAIVIGSHGHSALAERVLGGVAHRVMGNARCPVLVIAPA